MVWVALLRRTSSPNEVACINLTEKYPYKFQRQGTWQQSKELAHVWNPILLSGFTLFLL